METRPADDCAGENIGLRSPRYHSCPAESHYNDILLIFVMRVVKENIKMDRLILMNEEQEFNKEEEEESEE